VATGDRAIVNFAVAVKSSFHARATGGEIYMCQANAESEIGPRDLRSNSITPLTPWHGARCDSKAKGVLVHGLFDERVVEDMVGRHGEAGVSARALRPAGAYEMRNEGKRVLRFTIRSRDGVSQPRTLS